MASANIDLGQTLASGQTFAFVPLNEGFIGVVDHRPLYARESEGKLTLSCPEGDAAFWRRYFDLDRDYDSLLAPHLGSGPLDECYAAFPGVRLLRQPIWEALCAFILSANNHQSRIQKMYLALSERYGDTITWQGRTLNAFPSPQALAAAGELDLRALGMGYRAPYLLATARMVAEGFPLNVDALAYEDALRHLTQLKGVGEKVADCVLLFASRHGCAFPVDIWMERVLVAQYGMAGTRQALKRQAQAHFGEASGLAQQYLFHGARTGIIKCARESGTA